MLKNWIGRSDAVKTYGLTFDQIDYGIFTGILQHREMGGGIIVLKSDLEKHLEELKKLPQKIWIFKSEAIRKYKLTKNQIEMAMKQGLVRYKEVKNPHYRQMMSTKLLIMDIESKLEEIKSFPKYSEIEKKKRKTYIERSKARRELEFFCPRCKTTIRPLRGSRAFEEYWVSGNKEEILRRLIIAHYRHAHTDYDVERNNIDKWISHKEVKRKTGYNSFKEFLKFYKNIKDELDRDEREYYIAELNALRSIATENAKQHYNKIAQKLAEEDGLIKN
jgi:hypothetical protein